MNIQDKSPPCAEQLLKPGILYRAYLQLTDSGRGDIAGLSVGSRRIKGIVYYRGIGCSSRVKGKIVFCKESRNLPLPLCPKERHPARPTNLWNLPWRSLSNPLTCYFPPHMNI